MRNRLHGSLALAALAGLVALAACQKKAAPEGDTGAGAAPADTAMTAPSTPDTATTSSAGEPAQISVTNAMPHPMVVKGDWGQGEQELGSVEGNQTKSFDVDAPAGSQVTLTATDKDASHSTSGTVTLEAATPASWTIQ
jgi:hypothetical protein